jgi:hypothetical protein
MNLRFVVLKEIDRIDVIQIPWVAIPTKPRGNPNSYAKIPEIAYELMEVMAEGTDRQIAIQKMVEKYLVESLIDGKREKRFFWREKKEIYEFYCRYCLCIIDLAKRYKSIWIIKECFLSKKKDGNWFIQKSFSHISCYFAESVAHAVRENFWSNRLDSYPNAGKRFDYISGEYIDN